MATSGSSQIGGMDAKWERLRTERRELEQMRVAFEAERNRDQRRINRDEAGQGQTDEHNVVEQVAAVMNTNSIAQSLGNLDVVRKEKTWENRANNPHFENKHNAPRINGMRIQGGGQQNQGRRNWNNNQNNSRNNRRRNYGNYRGYYNSNENFDQARSDFRMPDTRFPPPQETKNNGFSNPNGNNNGRPNENNLN
ncbi:putative uncharacterized protein DDB_G0286901 [Neodiprion virginianus]|uniref:putative uncharacterized protein DDB_G0286901 n=1 Tax=Neodiprion virginianus TaxID=2961670 RepID=UPI001EE72857|nr:putative uncharacterized protein DDB_G0286901 [Neodiprion virginianus]